MFKLLFQSWLVCFFSIASANPQQNSEDHQRITIVGGTGAIGAYFASKLADNMSVAVVGREGSSHLEQIQKEGLAVITTGGCRNIPTNKFSFVGHDLKGISFSPDIIFLALKQPDLTEELVRQLLSISTPQTLIVFTGNGVPFFFMRGLKKDKIDIRAVDPEGGISALLASRKIAFLHPVIATQIKKPGVIKVSRDEEKIKVTLATVTGDPIPEGLRRLNDSLSAAGISTHIEQGQAQRIILEKLQFSLSVNILSGLLNRTLDEIFYDPKLQPFLEYIATLVQNIGINLGIENVRNCEQFSKNTGLTRGHFSSFCCDLKTGKAPENKAIVDAAIELGRYVNSQNPQIQLNLLPLLKLKELVDRRIKGVSFLEEDIVQLCPAKAKL